jgi:hypothetical protein
MRHCQSLCFVLCAIGVMNRILLAEKLPSLLANQRERDSRSGQTRMVDRTVRKELS